MILRISVLDISVTKRYIIDRTVISLTLVNKADNDPTH